MNTKGHVTTKFSERGKQKILFTTLLQLSSSHSLSSSHCQLHSAVSYSTSFSSNFTPTKNLILTYQITKRWGGRGGGGVEGGPQQRHQQKCQNWVKLISGINKRVKPDLFWIISSIFIVLQKAILVLGRHEAPTRHLDIILPNKVLFFICFLPPKSLHSNLLLFQ